MFTGIIDHVGQVIQNERVDGGNRIVIDTDLEDLRAGESIAVNGVCLTVLPDFSRYLQFDVSPETLTKTTLAQWVEGERVHIERAMLALDRFGGHYVSGHVDGIAVVESLNVLEAFVEIKLQGFSREHMQYLLPKGSIAVDGVSLTINSVGCSSIELMIVPHTLVKTNLGKLRIGQSVNIEFDYLTRIVAHQLQLMGKQNYEVES